MILAAQPKTAGKAFGNQPKKFTQRTPPRQGTDLAGAAYVFLKIRTFFSLNHVLAFLLRPWYPIENR